MANVNIVKGIPGHVKRDHPFNGNPKLDYSTGVIPSTIGTDPVGSNDFVSLYAISKGITLVTAWLRFVPADGTGNLGTGTYGIGISPTGVDYTEDAADVSAFGTDAASVTGANLYHATNIVANRGVAHDIAFFGDDENRRALMVNFSANLTENVRFYLHVLLGAKQL